MKGCIQWITRFWLDHFTHININFSWKLRFLHPDSELHRWCLRSAHPFLNPRTAHQLMFPFLLYMNVYWYIDSGLFWAEIPEQPTVRERDSWNLHMWVNSRTAASLAASILSCWMSWGRGLMLTVTFCGETAAKWNISHLLSSGSSRSDAAESHLPVPGY